jgi:hypothetical protein
MLAMVLDQPGRALRAAEVAEPRRLRSTRAHFESRPAGCAVPACASFERHLGSLQIATGIEDSVDELDVLAEPDQRHGTASGGGRGMRKAGQTRPTGERRLGEPARGVSGCVASW